MKIVCISDTHMIHRSLDIPDGDILIHAGDITNAGSFAEFEDFNDWLSSLPHKQKVFIAGNHDWLFEKNHFSAIERSLRRINAHYLQDSEIQIGGIRIYGSPWTPMFFDWAFMRERGGELQKYWDEIPRGLDILITHGPPQGILDGNDRAGCHDLLQRVLEIKPRFHVFGHIHEGYGIQGENGTTFINAALSRGYEKYKKVPIVFEI